MDALKVTSPVLAFSEIISRNSGTQIKLVGIFDVDINRAQERASGFGVAAYSSLKN